MSENERIWQNLMELSITCGMNQRYAQYQLDQATAWSGTLDVIVLIVTVLTATLGGIALFRGDKIIPRLNVSLETLTFIPSLLAAVFGVVLVAWNSNDEILLFTETKQSWADLRADVDSAITDIDLARKNNDERELFALDRRYRDLLQKKTKINAREPTGNVALLEKFLKEEEMSRGSDLEPQISKASAADQLQIPPGTKADPSGG